MKQTFLLSIFLVALSNAAFGGAVGEMPIPNPGPKPRDPSLPLECTPDFNQWGHPSACNCVDDYKYNPKQGLCERVEQGRLDGAVPHVGGCKNARGSIRFSSDRYQGGAAPHPDLVVYAVSLEQNGRVKGEIVQTADGRYQVNNWPFDVNFIERTKRVITRTGNQAHGSETYTVLLIVKSHRNGAVKIRERVTCESSWDYMRP